MNKFKVYRMSKMFLLVIVIIVSKIANGQDKLHDFIINGELKDYKLPKVYLKYKDGENLVIDSVDVMNDKFLFAGKISSPVIASISDTSYLIDFRPTFFIEEGNIQFKTISQSFDRIDVEGTISNNEFTSFRTTTDSIETIYSNKLASNNNLLNNDSILRQLKIEKDQFIIDKKLQFIRTHQHSYLSISFLYSVVSNKGSEMADQLFATLDPVIKQSYLGINCYKYITYKNQASIGKQAPIFTLKDTSGQSISLTNFKGKYVLVDFWASWCGPCRAENPNFLKAVNAYKSKNFDFIGISIDDSHHVYDWKAAIIKDQTPWTQLLDDFKNPVADNYGVTTIPSNFLIDPNGKVVARDLRGKKLWEILSQIIK